MIETGCEHCGAVAEHEVLEEEFERALYCRCSVCGGYFWDNLVVGI